MNTKNSTPPLLHRQVPLLALWVLGAGSAIAKPVITNLGLLSGGSFPASYSSGISADGLVVTGQSSSSAGTRAFRWTAAGGLKNLGALPGFTYYSVGSALSADGAVITGVSYGPGLATGRGFHWSAATGMQSLGVLGTGSQSVGNAISADGLVIVGGSYTMLCLTLIVLDILEMVDMCR